MRRPVTPGRFTPQVCQKVMAGMPRMSGARAALEHFDVPDAARRAEEYAARKQVRVVELIEAGCFTAFPDALRFLLAVKDSWGPGSSGRENNGYGRHASSVAS